MTSRLATPPEQRYLLRKTFLEMLQSLGKPSNNLAPRSHPQSRALDLPINTSTSVQPVDPRVEPSSLSLVACIWYSNDLTNRLYLIQRTPYCLYLIQYPPYPGLLVFACSIVNSCFHCPPPFLRVLILFEMGTMFKPNQPLSPHPWPFFACLLTPRRSPGVAQQLLSI